MFMYMYMFIFIHLAFFCSDSVKDLGVGSVARFEQSSAWERGVFAAGQVKPITRSNSY